MTEDAVANPAGKTIGQLDAEERAADLARVITVRCADCLDEWTGPAAQARRDWAEHRRDEHADARALEALERSLAEQDRLVGRRKRIVIGNKTLEENYAAV